MELKSANWTPQLGAERVLARCDELALCSDEPGRLTRLFLSPALAKAHQLVGGWMRAAGLLPRVDALGNLLGYLPTSDPDAPVWALGSHLDTVPGAGKYDGMLGVLLVIEVVASLQGEQLPFGIEVIGFSDEEGVRFKTPYLGSRAVAGSFDPKFLELQDTKGVALPQAMQNFGLDPTAWPTARFETPLAGYFEAHIEQGPVLESLGAPLGIVTAIAGQSRVRVRFLGQPGHAGTLPMSHRRDALAAASEWVLEVEKIGCRTPGLMATVGFVEVAPNTANVVPGEVTCGLDVRHADDRLRENAVAELLDGAEILARRRGVGLKIVSQATQQAVPMDTDLIHKLRAAVGPTAPDIVSGAGHDAAIMAEIAPIAMLFLRTPTGVSHCPEEDVNLDDVALALKAMRAFLKEI